MAEVDWGRICSAFPETTGVRVDAGCFAVGDRDDVVDVRCLPAAESAGVVVALENAGPCLGGGFVVSACGVGAVACWAAAPG